MHAYIEVVSSKNYKHKTVGQYFLINMKVETNQHQLWCTIGADFEINFEWNFS